MELGKLFIGGISWDTDEDKLRNYFQAFGEVVQVMIMKDRATGRARGFGFVVFSDPSVAERVVMKKHLIDGRNVEAKKAVPREDQNVVIKKNCNNIYGSLGPVQRKKIFVGGLASTVTETDFKNYFDQFGTIKDVIVMYDQNTQRPRGFGFITYDSEEAVEKVLEKKFHELNGKLVEVKRAVPKELSLVQPQSPLVGFDFSLSRVSSFSNGFSSNAAGRLGSRMNASFSPVGAYSPFGPGFGLSFDQGFSPSYGGISNLSSNLGYGRLSASNNGSFSKHERPIGYSEGNGIGGDNSLFNSTSQTLWENRSIDNTSITATGDSGVGFLGRIGANRGFLANTGKNAGFAYSSCDSGYRGRDLGVSLGGVGFGSSGVTDVPISSVVESNDINGGPYKDIFENGSFFGDSSWLPSSLELDRNTTSDVLSKSSSSYVDGYSVADRQGNRDAVYTT